MNDETLTRLDLTRATSLAAMLATMSDSEFAITAMGDDGEELLGSIVGTMHDLLSEITHLRERVGELEKAGRLAMSYLNDPDGGTDDQYREAQKAVAHALLKDNPNER